MFSPIRHSTLLRAAAGKAKVEQRVVVLAQRMSPVAESFRQVAREIELGIDAARPAAAGEQNVESSEGIADAGNGASTEMIEPDIHAGAASAEEQGEAEPASIGPPASATEGLGATPF